MGDSVREWTTIVVGFDGSANARDAVTTAAGVLTEGGTVHAVTAYRLPSVSETERLWKELPEEFRSNFDVLAGPESLRSEAVGLLEGLGVNAVGHLVEGDAASSILDTVDEVDADLVVVGSRGLGRATRFLRGSVSSKVASHAKTSVLVVQPED
jgi:nucleotide-binding universal stress UspA family protein